MIDFSVFDGSISDIKIRKSQIPIICDSCGLKTVREIRKKSEIVRGDIPWLCLKCKCNTQDFKSKISSSSKSMWENKEFQNKYKTKEFREKCSGATKKRDDQWKNKMREIANSEKKERSARAKRQWKDPQFAEIFRTDEHRKKMSEITTKLWEHNEEFKSKFSEARSKQPRTSSIQEILYSILDDLNIKHYREYPDKPADPETVVGPYNFDCVIPLKNKKLLIECQGDYWHSLPQVARKDKAKNTYINEYYPDCELRYLWEHEFLCKDKIVELIKYWVGANHDVVDFEFSDVKIQKCPQSDYRSLLSKYHYLSNAGRGGISYGAYLGNELIAVCVFSPLIRQNLPHDPQTTRELSRLCIHPRYQKKNFASWFVSKCIKLLPHKYKKIISYCDTTFNHNGAVYKACGFELDGEITPDYWYVSEDGWVMHKKTLYNHAIKMSMTEEDYAKRHNYKRVYGKKKLRFQKSIFV